MEGPMQSVHSNGLEFWMLITEIVNYIERGHQGTILISLHMCVSDH